MATTNTVTSLGNATLYSFTALANGDTFDVPGGDFSGAEAILFQVTGGTFNSSTVALVGSLNGTNYAPLYAKNSIISAGLPVTAVSATSANVIVWDVQPCSKLRVTVTGGTGTGLTANLLILTRTA
jgi:hypothetical protein